MTLSAIPKDVGGRKADRVLASSASRGMALRAPTTDPDPGDGERLEQEDNSLKAEMHEVHGRLGEIKSRIIGRRLPPAEYRTLVEEQGRLSQRLAEIQVRRSEIKPRLKEYLRGFQAHSNDLLTALVQRADVTNELLAGILNELRKGT